jgi:hypothetical protein
VPARSTGEVATNSVGRLDREPCSVADLINAGGTVAAKAVPGFSADATEIAGAGVVVAAAVVVSWGLGIFAGRPIVGLPDTFSPLGWRVPVGLS